MATRNDAPGGLFNGGNVGTQSAPRGPAGPQGEAGPQGPAGAIGPQGPQGERGLRGENGTDGRDGAAGAQGPRGEIGPQGATGPRGLQGARGAQGARGPQGPAGDTGATGPAGPRGLQGEAGPQGERGLTGARGPAGPSVQGPAGQTGAAGPTGPRGATGPQGRPGPQGPAGATGASGSRGEPGAAGPRGATGARGLQGPQGPQGPQGDSIHGVIVTERGSSTRPTTIGFTSEDANGNINTLPGTFQVFPGETGPAGAQGPQGDTGAQGPQGDTGLTGAQGPRGPRGATGATGARGERGAPGNIGPQGPQGPRGLTGPAGADSTVPGPQGPRGDTGDTGPRGAAGARGATGARGPVGPAGIRGLTGPQGERGATGDTGPQGPQGATGPQGLQGPIGPRGATGEQGEQGERGERGLTGPQGETGPPGRFLRRVGVQSVNEGQTLEFDFDFSDATNTVSIVDLPSVEIATEIIQMTDDAVRVTNGRLMRGFNFESDGIYVCLVNGEFSNATLLDTRLFRRIDDIGATPPGPNPLNLMLNDAEFIGTGTGVPTTPIANGRLGFNAGDRLAVTYTLAGMDAPTSMIQSVSTVPTALFNGVALPLAETIPANPVGASSVTYIWTLTNLQQTTNNARITFTPLVVNAGPNAQNVVEVRDDAAPQITITDARSATLSSTVTELSALSTDDVPFTTALTGIDLRDPANVATVTIDNNIAPIVVANDGSFSVPRASLGTTGTRTVTLRITHASLPTVTSSHMIELYTPFFTYNIPRNQAYDQFRQTILDTTSNAMAAGPSDEGYPPPVRQVAAGTEPRGALVMEIEQSLVPRASYSFSSPFPVMAPFDGTPQAVPNTFTRTAADGTNIVYERYYIVPSIPDAGVRDLTFILS